MTMKHLISGKVVVLGVCSSISAYKAADICSKLMKLGVEVHVIMTANATKLITPRVFQTLTHNDVTTDLWAVDNWKPEHTALADKADLFVVVPATANFLGQYANGLAPDALSTYALANRAPTVIFPAMNPFMWSNTAVRDNVATIRRRGARVVTPASGIVACGDEGVGKLPGVDAIVETIEAHLSILELAPAPRSRVVVTAGPTEEHIDVVRFLTNRSTGKMGYCLAAAAAALGHEVTLVSGPVDREAPLDVKLVRVSSARDMLLAVQTAVTGADVLIMAAAVADYTYQDTQARKIKKAGDSLTLNLTRTIDILATISASPTRPKLVGGFAAESHDVIEYALGKLERKGLDFIVANDISGSDRGFGSDHNEVAVLARGGNGDVVQTDVSFARKMTVAAHIFDAAIHVSPGVSSSE
ncbi:Coenzyme A biosynthesis bifunctional protein CoaBC [Carpediemonas membranifera]|uniref:Coenzyme A biosynthesis bifunctional protein CoaBC n=1 Tax=Carpediemonas membranifera TaxID=201153 RepID=A0A8J6E4S8_9EUKA|nr:Coenzyme A biosynthesis bifunctional protein CoaBC [Carpediemonas membranifera]|eukprot:KAG9397316.1 Coenzyme A biosynthesis bifunctional protein CoaBC [Carpediemonas membranifera]